jgi:LemA protein
MKIKTSWIVLGVILLLFVGGCSSYNGMVTKRNEVNAAWAQVENVYQRRMDLIPNLVNTVKGSANFEQKTLTEIAEMRASVGKANVTFNDKNASIDNRVQAANQMESALSRLLVISEQYPQLRSTEAFSSLMEQLEGTENRVSVERGKYNEVVKVYNNSILKFPQVMLAGMFGFKEHAYFEAVKGAEKAPTVDFENESK